VLKLLVAIFILVSLGLIGWMWVKAQEPVI